MDIEITHYTNRLDDNGRPYAVPADHPDAAGPLPEGWDDTFWDWQGGQWVHMPDVRREALLAHLRAERNRLLDLHRWTVTPDSPLSDENRAQWSDYLRALHRITVDFPDGENVSWPEPPPLAYS